MTARGFTRTASAVIVCALLVSAVAVSGVLSRTASFAVDDVAQLFGGTVAAVVCWFSARSASPGDRAWRLLLGTGMAAWTTGQSFYTWYQLFAGRSLPSPSLADVGYLTMPVFALAALLAFPTSRRDAAADGAIGPNDPLAGLSDHAGRPATRTPIVTVVDALILVGSMAALSWATALGAVVRGRTPGGLGFGVAVAYPITDFVLVVVVALSAAFGRSRRCPALFLLGTGLVCLAVSDSLFAYLVARGADEILPVYNVGFVVGPLFLALAALAPRRLRHHVAAAPASGSPWAHILLPYLPLLATGAVMVAQIVTHTRADLTEVWLATLVVVLVLVRQLITLVENEQLLDRVREGQRRLRHQAFHDPLTRLANRALFADRLQHAVALHQRDGHPVALLFIDLDDFKSINDGLGHAVGDRVLQEIADRLRAGVRGSDTVARLGGDEFAVLVEGGGIEPDVMAEQLLARIRRPVLAGGHPRQVGASIGLAVGTVGVLSTGGAWPAAGAGETLADELTADALLQRADTAMYAAKKRGKGSVVRYEPRTPATDLDTVLRDDLLRVLTSGTMPAGFTVVYQPIVRLADRRVIAVEALVRWVHPARGTISPDLFVSAAERAGAVAALDDLVLDRACADLAGLRGGAFAPTLHVNVSASRLADHGLPSTVAAAISRHGIPPDALVLEVTETSSIPDVETAATVLGAVRRLGVRIAVDDYGAGHGTMHHLHRLPLDLLKLDKTLVTGAFPSGAEPRPDDRDPAGEPNPTGAPNSTGERSAALARSITDVAHSLGLTVVAEGIETEARCAEMAGIGADLGQGFLFGRPAPLAQIPASAPGGEIDTDGPSQLTGVQLDQQAVVDDGGRFSPRVRL